MVPSSENLPHIDSSLATWAVGSLCEPRPAPAIELWMMVCCLCRDDILHQLEGGSGSCQLESLAHPIAFVT